MDRTPSRLATDRLDALLDSERLAIGDLIITELLQGFRTEAQVKSALAVVDRLEYFDLVGPDIAIKAARNYRILRASGVTVRKTIEMIIGAFCIERRITLLHNDRDFDPMVKRLGLLVA
jgi:predicted nucleic acid-binding protein